MTGELSEHLYCISASFKALEIQISRAGARADSAVHGLPSQEEARSVRQV